MALRWTLPRGGREGGLQEVLWWVYRNPLRGSERLHEPLRSGLDMDTMALVWSEISPKHVSVNADMLTSLAEKSAFCNALSSMSVLNWQYIDFHPCPQKGSKERVTYILLFVIHLYA